MKIRLPAVTLLGFVCVCVPCCQMCSYCTAGAASQVGRHHRCADGDIPAGEESDRHPGAPRSQTVLTISE